MNSYEKIKTIFKKIQPMENPVIKFSLRLKNAPIGKDSHWTYCCGNRVPYVRISQSGTKYWKVNYDILPLTMFERFVVIYYTDHTIPFYDKYCKDCNLPQRRQVYSGSGGCLMFTVYKEDATGFAEKLYDMLVQLSLKDQEQFETRKITPNKSPSEQSIRSQAAANKN